MQQQQQQRIDSIEESDAIGYSMNFEEESLGHSQNHLGASLASNKKGSTHHQNQATIQSVKEESESEEQDKLLRQQTPIEESIGENYEDDFDS